MEARHFLGEPVAVALSDGRDGALYAALNLGHFGVKLHRRDVGGASGSNAGWTEIATPAYPVKPDDSADPLEWKNKQIWALAAGGADQPGVRWAGTLPGGLFRSSDRGDSWELVRALWDVPQRGEWFGGGYHVPGIHSISVDPRNSARVLVAVSCGGVWRTEDGGASWVVSSTGMRADYMPPELNENEAVQDPHRVVCSAGSPDVLWCQHPNGIWRSSDGGRRWEETTGVPVSNFGFAVGGPSARRQHGLVRAGRSGPAPHSRRLRAGGDAHARRGAQLRGLARRLAAGAMLRPGVPPRPGRVRRRQQLADGLDHGWCVGVKRRGRELADGVEHDAAGVCGLLRGVELNDTVVAALHASFWGFFAGTGVFGALKPVWGHFCTTAGIA